MNNRKQGKLRRGAALLLAVLIAVTTAFIMPGVNQAGGAAAGLAGFAATALASDDFTIDSGVLTEYTGTAANVTIPDTVTSIGANAFDNLDITSVTIPASVVYIEDSAFNYCYALETVTFEGDIPVYVSAPFEGTNGFKIICHGDRLSDAETMADDTGITGATFESRYMAGYVFYSATEGKTLPDSVKKLTPADQILIQNGMTLKPSVSVFAAVTEEGGTWSFSGWDASEVTVNGADVRFKGAWTWAAAEAPKHTVGYAFTSGTDGRELPAAVTAGTPESGELAEGSETAPSSDFGRVTVEDGFWSFSGWDAPRKVMGTEGLIFTGTWTWSPAYTLVYANTDEGKYVMGIQVDDAFKERKIDVVIPDSDGGVNITAIADSAFYNIDYKSRNCIRSVVVGNNVKKIGDMAFQYCNSLEKITIPASVTEINPVRANGTGALSFTLMGGLKEFDVDDANPAYEDIDGVLFNKDGTELINYPEGRKDTSYALPDSVERIREAAFKCAPYYGVTSALTSVDFSLGLKEIGRNAFMQQSSLTSIEIPAGVTLGDYAFNLCTGLKTVVISEGVTSLPTGFLYGLEGIESLTLPSTLRSIGYRAFDRCNITSVVLPEGLESIEEEAFENCKLTEINIPSTVTKLGTRAFYSGADLRKVTFAEGAKLSSVGAYAFNHCTALDEVALPDSVTTLENGAFSCCYALNHIDLPDSVTTLEDLVFSGSGLESIVLPDSIVTMGSGTFRNCVLQQYDDAADEPVVTGLRSVTLPAYLESLGTCTFEGCAVLSEVNIPDTIRIHSVPIDTFFGCRALRTLDLPVSITSTKPCAFADCSDDIVINCGVEEKDFYRNPFDACSLDPGEDYELIDGEYYYIGDEITNQDNSGGVYDENSLAGLNGAATAASALNASRTATCGCASGGGRIALGDITGNPSFRFKPGAEQLLASAPEGSTVTSASETSRDNNNVSKTAAGGTKTGDYNSAFAWMILLIVGLSGMTISVCRFRR